MPNRDPEIEARRDMPKVMTDDEMVLTAKNDRDAAPLSERMLNRANAQHRLEKSRPHRIAAAQALIHERDPKPASSKKAK